MKRFNLKIRKMAFAGLLTLAPTACILPIDIPSSVTTVNEDQFLQDLTNRIIALCQVAQDAFIKFTDSNNQEGYSIHVNRFASAIGRFREEIIRPILDRLATSEGESKRALIIAQEIVNDMINQLAVFHAALAKHINSTNAIALKNDLEPVIASITSQALYQKTINKLSELEASINTLGHTSFANKITEMQNLVTKAYQNYHATKGQDRNKAFQLLMRRLKKK
jgi:hypothetical protein